MTAFDVLDYKKTIGRRLHHLRLTGPIGIRSIAQMGVCESTVRGAEQGSRAKLPVPLLIRLASIYGAEPSWLLYGWPGESSSASRPALLPTQKVDPPAPWLSLAQQNLHDALERVGRRQRDLAEEMGVDPSAISRQIGGKYILDVYTLGHAAACLGYVPGDFLLMSHGRDAMNLPAWDEDRALLLRLCAYIRAGFHLLTPEQVQLYRDTLKLPDRDALSTLTKLAAAASAAAQRTGR